MRRCGVFYISVFCYYCVYVSIQRVHLSKVRVYPLKDRNTHKICLLNVFVGISIVPQRHFYQFDRLRFLPLNLESFAYRHVFKYPILLQCKSNEFKYRVMKLINILSILCILFITASCSSEGDLLDGVETPANSETKTEAYSYAEFEFALSTNSDVQTRSSSVDGGLEEPNSETTEASVVSCYIAVINESGNVIASDFYSTYNTGDFGYKKDGAQLINKHMTIKVPANDANSKLTFFAVANLEPMQAVLNQAKIDKDGFMNCKTLKEIQDNLIVSYINIFVKQGSIEKSISDLKLKETVSSDNDSECNSIVIPVNQVTSAVLLESFKIRRNGADNNLQNVIDARVKSVELINLKNKTYLNSDLKVEDASDNYTTTVGAVSIGDKYTYHKDFNTNSNLKYEHINQIRFYTYRNETQTDAFKTALRVVYTLEEGGAEYTKTFTIKTPDGSGDYSEKVAAGKLYKLSVTVSESSGDNIQYVVKDWIPNKIDLGDINGSAE